MKYKVLSLVVMLVSVFIFSNTAQAITISYDFDTLTGWTHTGAVSAGLYSTVTSPAGGNYLILDAGPQADTNDASVSKINIPTSYLENILVQYYRRFEKNSTPSTGFSFLSQYNINGGSWSNIESPLVSPSLGSWVNTSPFALPASANNSVIGVSFKVDDTANGGGHEFGLVDGLQVSGDLIESIGIQDVNQTDANTIASVSTPDYDNNTLEVNEDYNETQLTPYTSHDGYAVVNSQDGYFDKLLTFRTEDTWDIDFDVLNTTPYDWSDYHFEFYNLAGGPLSLDGKLTWQPNSIFGDTSFDGYTLAFSDEDNLQLRNTSNIFSLTFDLGELYSYPNENYSFIIRQIATTTIPEIPDTTVPEPATISLLGMGLLSLLGFRKKISA